MGTAAFDVDGTLIDADDKPRAEVIAKLVEHRRKGDIVYVWSGGGVEYAQQWVDRLCLNRYVDAVIAKQRYKVLPDVVYDDQEVKLGKKNIQVR